VSLVVFAIYSIWERTVERAPLLTMATGQQMQSVKGIGGAHDHNYYNLEFVRQDNASTSFRYRLQPTASRNHSSDRPPQ
jgi:hypothetical protein